MKLKTLSKINQAVTILLGFVMLPFVIVHCVLDYAAKPFEWVYDDLLMRVRRVIGNRLLLMSDEVKNGTIQNSHYLNHCTASWVYKTWRDYHHFHKVR